MNAELLRIVALDHFFDQDLRELDRKPGVEVRRIPYTRFRDRALKILGADVGTGIERYADPDLASRRRVYAAWLTGEVERIFMEWPADIWVVPSDTFFYVRALPEAAHKLGMPVAVVQKETTISPAGLDLHAPMVGQFAPLVSDLMTVCSEAQRAFWLRTGAARDRIKVTGQPRFDIYARARGTWQPRKPREVLYLSYELDAYEPGAGRGRGGRTWEQLRNETEQTLVDLALAGEVQVTVKHHPQQDLSAEPRRLRRLAGEAWGRGVRMADALQDTRELIVSADVVVGFQTTALYEAVAAGRPTIFAAWGDAFERHRGKLIPFHESNGGVFHARGPAELADLVVRATPRDIKSSWFEAVLGPVDGHSTTRAARHLQSLASTWTRTKRATQLSTTKFRRQDAARRLGRVLVKESILRQAAVLAPIVGRGRGADFRLSAVVDQRHHLLRNLVGHQ